jgi:hypothetical protein
MIKTEFFLSLILFILPSCGLLIDFGDSKSPWRDIQINLSKSVVSEHIEIQTKIEKYVPSRNWFYGSITMKNNTIDTLQFNFNQRIVYEGDTLQSTYNFRPISYAHEAFQVLPNSIKSWNVVWLSKKKYTENLTLEFVLDSLVARKNEFR